MGLDKRGAARSKRKSGRRGLAIASATSERQWKIIDLMAVARALDDPVGPMEPSAAFLRAVKKRYPGVPSDILPRPRAAKGFSVANPP